MDCINIKENAEKKETHGEFLIGNSISTRPKEYKE